MLESVGFRVGVWLHVMSGCIIIEYNVRVGLRQSVEISRACLCWEKEWWSWMGYRGVDGFLLYGSNFPATYSGWLRVVARIAAVLFSL